jgi:hypothetical protein
MTESDKITQEKKYTGPAIDIAIRIGDSLVFPDIKALYLSGDLGSHPCYCILPRLQKTQGCPGRP